MNTTSRPQLSDEFDVVESLANDFQDLYINNKNNDDGQSSRVKRSSQKLGATIQSPPKSLEDIILDKRNTIMFFGESFERSLPCAVARLRGSWTGITASRSPHVKDPPKYCQYIAAVSRGEPSAQQSLKPANKARQELAFVLTESSPKRLAQPYIMQIDEPLFETILVAEDSLLLETYSGLSLYVDVLDTAGPNSLKKAMKKFTRLDIGIFQCPWSFVKENGGRTTSDLIRAYFARLHEHQVSGAYAVLGVIEGYENHYISSLKKENGYGSVEDIKTIASSFGYCLHSVDKEFIQKCIDYGYTHVSYADTAPFLCDSAHTTYVFRKS